MTDKLDHIGQLRPDPHNARKHNPRNVEMIERSLHEVGAARSIVIDEEGNILAGNATVEAAALAGIEKVKVVEADGETIIAVRRSGLTEEQKRRLALYDNRTAELADWDVEVLEELSLEDGILDGLFENWELRRILEDFDPANDVYEEWRGMPEYEQKNIMGMYKTIMVHFENEEAVQDFAKLVGQEITNRTKYIWYPKRERENLLRYAVVSKENAT